MDKLNNVLGTGFKKENLLNLVTKIVRQMLILGKYLRVNLQKTNLFERIIAGISKKKGKELPEKRESASSRNNDAEKKVKLADKIVESDSEEIEKTKKDDLESVESTNNL